MAPAVPDYPFQASPQQLKGNLDRYVDVVVGSLQSYYLVMPKTGKFLEYERFGSAYQVLAKHTKGFERFSLDTVLSAITEDPVVFVVLRSILGLSPPELAHLTGEKQEIEIDQGYARLIDQQGKEGKQIVGTEDSERRKRVQALVKTALAAIGEGIGLRAGSGLHRLDKIDTRRGLDSLRQVARIGVPYPALLYERFLGRPFASHRDSVSEMVGELIEAEIIKQLDAYNVPYHCTERAERLPGFDQAPDFLAPNSKDPKVVIEAKLTEDDGTARDKVTRVQHLGEIGRRKGFEVVACIDGRGFSVRREDMKKLLLATGGKVFTLATIYRLVPETRLSRIAGTEKKPPKGA